MTQKLRSFFKEAQQEWHHVNWPTRREAMYLTGIVIGLSLVLAFLLGAFDYIFLSLLKVLVLRM